MKSIFQQLKADAPDQARQIENELSQNKALYDKKPQLELAKERYVDSPIKAGNFAFQNNEIIQAKNHFETAKKLIPNLRLQSQINDHLILIHLTLQQNQNKP